MMLKSWTFWAKTWWFALGGWKWHRKLRRETGEVYMDRWQLLKTRLLSVYVNRINLPDYDELLHNHPWPRAYSLKLKGSYVEQLPGLEFRRPGRWNRIPKEHRITRLINGAPVWTLFIGLNKYPDSAWGFIANDGAVIPHQVRRAQRGVESEV
jgi:hypothetical protein